MTKKKWLNFIRKSNKFKIEKVIDYWGINLVVKMRKI